MAMEMVLKEHRLSKDGTGDGLEAKRFELHVENDSSYEQVELDLFFLDSLLYSDVSLCFWDFFQGSFM